LCFMGYPLNGAERFCIGNTNGVAAGQSLEDALTAAMLELVERDAIAIWWYNRVRRPALNINALDSPDVARVRDAAPAHGITVELLDLTTDVSIPVCAAVATNDQGALVALGAAAHSNPVAAASRAASELSQMWFWANQDDSPRTRAWFRGMSHSSDPYLEPSGTANPLPPTELTLDGCLQALGAAGLCAYWVDLTRPEIGVPVVRVVIPSLRHSWNRLAPGRLYDVPVRLGWRREPTPEQDMNPRLCPI
jgi:ribosomal protein S12 methylthiotransferase accessory factor YcaO